MVPHTTAELTAELQSLSANDDPDAILRFVHRLREHIAGLESENRELREGRRLLEDARERYAELFDFAPIGYCLLDETGVIHAINLTGATLLGADRMRLIGRPFADALSLAQPARLAEHLERCRTRGARVRSDLSAILPTGHPITLALVSVPDERGVGWRASTAFTDVTLERESARFQAFLSETSVALSRSLDLTERAQVAARATVPALADLCMLVLDDPSGFVRAGYASRTGVTLEDDPTPPPRVAASIRAALASGQLELISDAHWLRLQRLSSALAVPIGVDGRRFGALILGFEGARVADRAQLGEYASRVGLAMENARLHHEVLGANRAKDEFFAVVSHELRTPLGALLMWSQVLRAATDATQRDLALDAIDESARSQARLVDDLLDVARAVTGRLTLSLERVVLAALLERVADSFRPTFTHAGVELEVSIAPDGGEVRGDPQRLRQLVGNLLENAMHASERGGVVRLSLTRDHAEVRLEVRDAGRGIGAEELPHIFDAFRQHDGASSRRRGGMGLGLAIVRALAVQHGGSVTAASDGAGQGAIFTVTLPRTPESSTGHTGDWTERPTSSTNRLRGVRVLVVDDHTPTRDGVAVLLAQYGAIVSEAASAEEALVLVRAQPPDIVVSDIALPGADGHELAQRVRARAAGSHVRLVALTARTTAADRARALAAGFELHIEKPAQPAVLLHALAGLLD
jgi:PAS domain S-box-containing protein